MLPCIFWRLQLQVVYFCVFVKVSFAVGSIIKLNAISQRPFLSEHKGELKQTAKGIEPVLLSKYSSKKLKEIEVNKQRLTVTVYTQKTQHIICYSEGPAHTLVVSIYGQVGDPNRCPYFKFTHSSHDHLDIMSKRLSFRCAVRPENVRYV